MRDFIIGILLVCVAYLLFKDDTARDTFALDIEGDSEARRNQVSNCNSA